MGHDFKIVGIFETEAAAQKAVDELHFLLSPIAAWYRAGALLTPSQALQDSKLSPIELWLSNEYDVEWSEPHRWLFSQEAIDEGLVHYKHYAFLEFDDTDTTYKPYDAVMTKLGGKVLIQSSWESTRIVFRVLSVAPNLAVLERVFNELTAYLEIGEYFGGNAHIPWIIYLGGEKHPNAEIILSAEAKRLAIEKAEKQAQQQWYKENKKSIDLYWEENLKNTDYITYLQSNPPRPQWEQERDARIQKAIAHLPTLSDEEQRLYFEAFRRTSVACIPNKNDGISRDQLTLKIEGLYVFEIAKGIPALAAYLEDTGFVNIEITPYIVPVE